MSRHIVCNQCGKSSLENRDDFSKNLFHSFHVEFIFGSDKDGTLWNFDLCEDCIIKMVESFAVPLDTDDIDEGVY